MFSVLRRRRNPLSNRNLLKNNTSMGLVAGTPGTMPTNWDSYTPDSGAGITTQLIGPSVEDGIDCWDFHVSGTPTAGGTCSVRAVTTLSYATRTNSTWNKPTGAITGDVLVCLMQIIGSHTTAPAVTPPSGFVEQTSPGNYTDSGSNQSVWHIYTKPAGGSEPSTYTFTHTSAGTEGIIFAVTGADTAISVVIGSLHQTDSTTTINYNAISATRANSLIIAWGVAWDDATGASVAGGTTPTFTSNFTGISAAISSGVWSSTGSTGSKSGTVTNSNTHTFGVLIAIQPTPSPASGFTGIFTNPLVSFQLPCVLGSPYTFSAYVKLQAGSLPQSITMGQNYHDGAGSFLSNNILVITPSSTLSLRNQRWVFPSVCDESAAACVKPNITFNYNTTLDCTLRIGLAQVERGLFASPAQIKRSL